MKRMTQKVLKTMAVFALLFAVVVVNKNVAKADSILVDGNEIAADAIKPGVISSDSDADYKNKVTMNGLTSDGVVPVKLIMPKSGIFIWQIAADQASASMGIYSDEACTSSVTSIAAPEAPVDGAYISATSAVYLKAGTYYVKSAAAGNFVIYSYAYSSETRTVGNKAWSAAGTKDSSTAVYFQVKTSGTSKLSVAFDASRVDEYNYSYYVTLCDSKKKSISDEKAIDAGGKNEKAVYAVPKGTYYIKVKTSNDLIRLMPTISKVTNKTGSSKSKAVSMKHNGGKITGVFTTSDKTSKTEWVKIVNTKTQPTYIYIDGQITSGKIEAEIIGLNGKSMGTLDIDKYYSSAGGKLYTYGSGYSGNTLAKGTYYVKINKDTTKTSGTYQIYLKSKALK